MSFSRIISLNQRLRNYRSFSVPSSSGGGYRTMNERLKDLLKKPTAPFMNPFILKDKSNEIFTVKWNHLAPAENILRSAKGPGLQLFIRTLEAMHEGINIEKRPRKGSSDDLFKICSDHAGSFAAIRDEDMIRRQFISELNKRLPFEGSSAAMGSIDADLEEMDLSDVRSSVKVNEVFEKSPFEKNDFQSVKFWTDGDGKNLINGFDPTMIMNQITPLIGKFNEGDHLQAATIYLGRAYNDSERIIIGIAMRIVFDFDITDKKKEVTKNDYGVQNQICAALRRAVTQAYIIKKSNIK